MVQKEPKIKEKNEDNFSFRSQSNGENEKSKSQINAEYFQALEQWLNDVRSYRYSCNMFAGFSYAMFAQQMNGFTPPNLGNFISNNSLLDQGGSPFPHLRPTQQQYHQQQSFRNQQQPQQQQQQPQNIPDEGVEYVIPPFWKRFIAEAVDFVLLFILKMAITFVAVDFFDIINIDEYNFQQQQEKMDYKVVLEITSKILSFELLYKFIVCLYEAIFLSKGMQNQYGGATLGKRFMGLRVVLCSLVEQVENRPNVVRVYPATDLGFAWSMARALLKNVVLSLLLPNNL
ncbi:conserved hypothetical protein [Pediculus humanus corporis]|uniref:RDD domain-containing protein n=1 Tax=Pediculus humanus subsp. corporis TaxID=121224 RepID=E0W4B4_PEDHC|nr:uncharacterized protein Phum_PHUM617070 [Pediculus humanus corporis]EEB20470.1 conserved hypothetical protein [Pediculus humanus corporis]